MPAPYIREFEFGGAKITSVVLDEPEFNAFVESFADVIHDVTPDMIQAAKAAQTVFLQRGRKTEPLFARFGVRTDRMSVIVRGAGLGVARRMNLLG